MIIKVKNAAGEVIKELEMNSEDTLLNQLLEAGVDIPYSCMTGTCASCMCNVESGEENLVKEWDGLEALIPLEENEVFTCVSTVKEGNGEVVLVTMD